MTDQNQSYQHNGNISAHPKPPSDEQVPRDIASSPAGSQASRSSSSRREHRIVELLHENESTDNSHQDDLWMIGADFYDEDVVEHQASDEEHPANFLIEQGEIYYNDTDEEEEDDDDDDDDVIIDMEVIPHVIDQSSSDESDEIEDEGVRNDADYDLTLPTNHQYLGENLQEFRGRKILAENSIASLLLFNLRHIVLLPGQVLPITISTSNYRVHALLKACIANGSTLVGLMSEPSENPIGTTAEIRNYSDNLEDELRIILEGRQRFKLISSPFETAIEGRVKILSEVSLGRPFPRIPSWQKFMTDTITKKKFIVSKHPHWILRNQEAPYMVKRIIEQVKNWCSGDPSNDATDFSYWMAANLPVSNHERMKALTFDCTEARLAWLLDILEKSEFFGCSACKNVICHKEDVFPMSCSGPQNSFVNQNGCIHDTLTVRNARSLLQNEWSNEYSWFPGYSWKVACCENCGSHIGWCYRTTKPGVKPKKFFGLSRANVRLQSNGPMHGQALPPSVFQM